MKIVKCLLISLFYLIEYSYSFKLNYTFNQGSEVSALSLIKVFSSGSSKNYLASGGLDSSIKIWDLENRKLKFTLKNLKGYVT